MGAMITYTINSMGGKEASGIPSLDVAISIATDLALYDDYHEEDEPWRGVVTVEDYPNEYKAGTFKMVYVNDREYYGIHAEERCEACRQVMPYRSSYIEEP